MNVEPEKKVQEKRSQVERRDEDYIRKKVRSIEVRGKQKKRRPKKK